MAEAFIVLPWSGADGSGGDAIRAQVEPLIGEIRVVVEDVGFRAVDVTPADVAGSSGGRAASDHRIVRVDNPAGPWSEWDLFGAEGKILDALDGLRFPSGSVWVTTDEAGRENRRTLSAPRQLP